ncbi:CARDB domain-containing protein [Paenibacillus sp. FSL H7-0331]|uniref:CARDB domain-containing protein n=1 Tax=Paenibacillus sp. FSL H7-0331 TaxID=1920421 RepID=UPI00096C634D|nr:CARDB domain-containing protein [Paenibacillus sp. FSL H7-0331]OMF06092.1 hypothetical protein BK127_31640 [Paenibacillus sp. FSL H7-0331]
MHSRRYVSCFVVIFLFLSFMPIRPWTAAAEDLVSSNAAGPLPVMKDISWSPVEPAIGNELSFQAVVENQGDAATSGSTTVRFTVDGSTVIQAVYEGAIEPLQTVTITSNQTWRAAPNHHKIKAEIEGTVSHMEKLIMLPAAELAQGKPITASSEKTSTGRTAAMAIDGNISTQWESAASPAHLVVDLGAPYDINKVVLYQGPDWSARTLTFNVEGSLDGNQFTTLAPAKDYRFEKTPKHKHEIGFNSANVRYVRLNGTYNSNAANGIQLTQLEVYQDPTYKNPSQIAANLKVTGLSWQPVNAFEGDSIVFHAVVENLGDEAYIGDLNVRFAIGSDMLTGTQAGVVLPKGWKTTLVSTPWIASAPTGTRSVSVHADGFESNVSSYPVRLQAANLRLPSQWTYNQIGSHELAGSATYSNGEFTLESSGFDIAGLSDEFSYVHQSTKGDVAVIARIQSLTAADSTASTGIMFRESLEANGNFVGLRLSANRSLRLDSRSNNSSVVTSNLTSGVTTPKYIKLEKTDHVFSAYVSNDGLQWGSPLIQHQQSLSGEVRAGVFAASKNRSQRTKAVFENLRMETINKPDLVIERVTLHPAAPKPGDQVTFTAHIKNQGLVSTNESTFNVNFKVDPSVNAATVSSAVYMGILQSGEMAAVTGNAVWSAVKGTHAVAATVDSEGHVEESNKQNNENIYYAAIQEVKNETEMTDFDKRARYIVQTFANEQPQQTDRTLWVKEAVFYAQARFELGTDVDTALQWINSINDNPAGSSMFFYTSNIDTYLKYGHLYPEALRQKVKQKLQAIDYSNNGSTENHMIKFRTAGYLVAQTWPDWSKAVGTKQYAEQDLRNLMNRFVKYGMKEYDSTTYLALYVECLLMLYEYAEDPSMKQQAKMTLDWMLANTGGEWVNGYWISSTLRDYEGISPKLGAAGNIIAWLYFGGDEQPRLRENELNYPEGMYSVIGALSSYRVPDILTRISSDRAVPHLHLESHDQHPTNKLNGPHGYRKTSFITKQYGVASQFDGNGTLGWSDQLRRWLVRWESDEPYSTFFMTHPKRGGIKSGATPYEQVLQKDGAIVAVYNIPASDPYPYVNAPFSSSFKKLVEDPSGWLFGHGGSVLLAVKPLKPYVWTQESIGSLSIPVLRSEQLKNGIIVETADPISYQVENDNALSNEERINNELQRFAQAIKSQTTVDTSGLDQTNPTITYTALSGENLSITYNGDRKINGSAVDYTAWPLIRSPFIEQEVGSDVMMLRHGGETLTYDFSQWTIHTPAESADLSVSQVGWSPDKPQVNDNVTFNATIRNAGLAAATGGFEITFRVDGSMIGTVQHQGALEPGKTAVITSGTWKPTEGKVYVVKAEVRLLNAQETNSSNNELEKSVAVSGPVHILFQDDFETNITTLWDSAGSVGSWSHVTDATLSSKVMKGTSTATTGNPVRKVAKSGPWEDYDETNKNYLFTFKAKYAEGTASNGTGEQMRTLVRFANPQAYYYFEFSSKKKTVSFVKYTTATNFITINQPISLTAILPGFNFNTYNQYSIKAEEDVFYLYINDQLVMQTNPDQDITAGSVGFMNRNSELWIDEVQVQSLQSVSPNPGDSAVFDFRLAPTPSGGNEIAIDVGVRDAQDLYGFVFDIAYDRNQLSLSKVEAHSDFGEHAYVGYQDHGTFVRMAGTRTSADGGQGINGEARLIRLFFTPVHLDDVMSFTLRNGSDYSNSQGVSFMIEEDIVALLALANADVNGDGKITINDLVLVAKAYGSKAVDDTRYKLAYDMNQDQIIDIADLSFIALKLLQK